MQRLRQRKSTKEPVQGCLPTEEQKRLDEAIGGICERFLMVGMHGCGEQFSPEMASRGFHELSWGAVLEFHRQSVGISWAEDEPGDPFRIAALQGNTLSELDTAEPQDVSRIAPWNTVVGSRLQSVALHAYQTNYRRGIWHESPWALELHFDSGTTLLFGALHHGGWECSAMAADEVVVFWDRNLIERVIKCHDSIENYWTGEARE